jgi:hypothetical protein
MNNNSIWHNPYFYIAIYFRGIGSFLRNRYRRLPEGLEEPEPEPEPDPEELDPEVEVELGGLEELEELDPELDELGGELEELEGGGAIMCVWDMFG